MNKRDFDAAIRRVRPACRVSKRITPAGSTESSRRVPVPKDKSDNNAVADEIKPPHFFLANERILRGEDNANGLKSVETVPILDLRREEFRRTLFQRRCGHLGES